jgi:hypothetical protein
MRSECGARGRSRNPHPGGFGHHLAGTTTGPGGAFPGLGLMGAGNARGRARGLCAPVGAAIQDRTSCFVPGNLAWSWCLRAARPKGVSRCAERRQASALFMRACRADEARWLLNSVCRRSAFPFFFRRCERSEAVETGGAVTQAPQEFCCFVAEPVVGPATSAGAVWLVSMTRQNSGVKAAARTTSIWVSFGRRKEAEERSRASAAFVMTRGGRELSVACVTLL